MKIPRASFTDLTKDQIAEILVDATEVLPIDIDDDLYAKFQEQAKAIGVSVEDFISAIIILRFRELTDKEEIEDASGV